MRLRGREAIHNFRISGIEDFRIAIYGFQELRIYLFAP
jgi:hypothetical protein